MSRTRTAFTATVTQFARTPVLLALLVALPAYFVGLLGYVLPDPTVAVHVPGVDARLPLGDALLPMLAVLAATMVTGIAGLFVTADTLSADGWLVFSGFPGRTLFVARAASLGAVAAVSSSAGTAVLFAHTRPDNAAFFLAATVLAAATYGLLGAAVGALLGRLAGVYVMLFAPAIDFFLVHSPLATDPPAWATILPGAHAGVAALSAALTATPDWTELGVAVVQLGVVTVVAAVIVGRAVEE